MALIASVKGKPVYSNKQMAAIIDGRVTFTDGSWCDVSTGQVHNNGSGYVNIGGPDSGSNVAKVTEGPKRVSASALEVHGINADVKVDVASKMDKTSVIEYTITGPADQVKAIRANVQGATLIIESGNPGSSGGGMTVVSGSVIQSGRGRTIISGDVVIGKRSVMSNIFGRGNVTSVVTGSGSGENEVQVTVKVPASTPVHVNGVLGDVEIGDINGPLVAKAGSSGTVYAGRVTSAQLTVSSDGDIRVKRVDGPVVAQVSSSGEIRVDDGDMPSLMATASSSGSIEIRGTATIAMLSASSSGDIRVARVRQQPTVSESSSGSVRVRCVG